MRMSTYVVLDSALPVAPLAPGERLKTRLGTKLAMALGLNLWALLPYYLLQHYPFFSVAVMRLTPVDEWTPFDDRAVWLYLSLFLLMPIAPMQFASTDQLRRYTLGVAGMSLLADLIFFFQPTTVLRPNAETVNIVYDHLTRLVSANNACPSLHAAMAVFSALCYEQVAPHVRHRQLWRTGLWIWALGIIYATLAAKQHVALDAVAGSALGFTAYFCAFRQNHLDSETVSQCEDHMNVTLPHSFSREGGKDHATHSSS
jgi:membrane-associated phospholipid phosphatase